MNRLKLVLASVGLFTSAFVHKKSDEHKTHPKTTDGLACTPDLLVVNLVELFLEIFTVSLSGIELERSSSLGTVPYGLVEGLEDRQVGPIPLAQLG
jgi:hypothetical protein